MRISRSNRASFRPFGAGLKASLCSNQGQVLFWGPTFNTFSNFPKPDHLTFTPTTHAINDQLCAGEKGPCMVFFICYTTISVSLFVCTVECLPVETRSVCCNLYILYDGPHFTFQAWLLRRAISLNVQEPLAF